MQVVGFRQGAGPVQVGALGDDGAEVQAMAGLEEFWSRAAEFLAQPPVGPSVPIADVQLVPPVLPGAG